MQAFLELLSSMGTLLLSFSKDPTEEVIENNMTFLKKYQWFQSFLHNENFERLIRTDSDVRFVIGKLNSNKMKRETYNSKYHKRIRKKLHEKSI